jgi:hypothetical protein
MRKYVEVRVIGDYATLFFVNKENE